MRAIELAEHGGPEVLKVIEAPDPVPDAGHVVIDVAVSGIQSLDGYLRQGLWSDFFPTTLPYIPGMEAAGVVSAVGADVDPSWVGRRVVAGLTNGGYATQVVVSLDKVVPVPAELALPDAMALLHDGSTALALSEETPVRAGETVLVQPAAGGLGTILVQLLVASGVRVIGAARGSSKLALVRELGADVVDYSAPDWLSQVGTVDVAFDGVSGSLGQAALSAVRDGGRYSNYGNASGSPEGATAERGISVRGIDQLGTFQADGRRRIEHIFDLAAAGKIRAIVGRTFPLDQAAEAHRAVEAREVLGKALLMP